ncbi:hypothetical protein TNCV_4812921 [Trichonephila clavipes]|nr:hypothetical protein TNCV_4812921 [Trichonephila clavipes]
MDVSSGKEIGLFACNGISCRKESRVPLLFFAGIIGCNKNLYSSVIVLYVSVHLSNVFRQGCGSPVVKVSDHGRHVMSSSPVPLEIRRILNWKKKLQLDKYDEGNIPEIIKKYFDKHLIGFNKENGPVHYFPFGKFDSRDPLRTESIGELLGRIYKKFHYRTTAFQNDICYIVIPHGLCVSSLHPRDLSLWGQKIDHSKLP